MTLYVHLPTLKVRRCYDFGGIWLVQIEFYGEGPEVYDDETFKKEWEEFNALKNYGNDTKPSKTKNI